ncbi:MAG: hypothetical protein J6A09_01625 [Alphaproteobacteria bacterium]|nr:hypothetical protein [Alphaproteobacteria bacterium]
MKRELKKAKRAVWLYRYFGQDIPLEYLEYVIKCQCCSKDFLEKFVLDYHLPQAFEMMFLEEYVKKDENLVAAYIKKFGCCKNVGHHMLIALSGSLFLYDVLNQTVPLDKDAQLAFFKGIHDKNERLKFVAKYRQSFYPCTVDYLLQMQNCDLFTAYVPAITFGNGLPPHQEQIIIRSKNLALFEILVSHCEVSNNTLESLITDDNIDYLQVYFVHHYIPSFIQRHLAKHGDKKLLALYVDKHPLSDEALFLLVNKGYKDILKLHYLNYGISERVLAYQANLTRFKSYIGIDETN